LADTFTEKEYADQRISRINECVGIAQSRWRISGVGFNKEGNWFHEGIKNPGKPGFIQSNMT
jgi:hypothetical protein